jgi:hypothetical protein
MTPQCQDQYQQTILLSGPRKLGTRNGARVPVVLSISGKLKFYSRREASLEFKLERSPGRMKSGKQPISTTKKLQWSSLLTFSEPGLTNVASPFKFSHKAAKTPPTTPTIPATPIPVIIGAAPLLDFVGTRVPITLEAALFTSLLYASQIVCAGFGTSLYQVWAARSPLMAVDPCIKAVWTGVGAAYRIPA